MVLYCSNQKVYVADNGATMSDHDYLPYYMNTHAILGKDFGTFVLLKNR